MNTIATSPISTPHITAATYQKILAHFQYHKLLGCTATPDRADKQALGRVFEKLVCPIDLREAIDKQYLVPIRQKFVQVSSLDFSRVRTTAGDLNEGDLEALMMQSKNLAEVAEWTVKLAGDRPTVVFGTTIAHAHALAALLEEHKRSSAVAIDGTFTPLQREETLTLFLSGERQFLCNCNLVTEGIDIPKIACVSMARPTKSRSLYAQCVGRSLRPSPDTGKSDALIIDFVGNAGRHSLVSTLDIFDGNMDEEVRARAERLCEADAGLSTKEALDHAQRDLEAEARTKLLAKVHTQVTIQDIDPFAILGVRPRGGRWGGAEITERQIALLQNVGLPWQSLDRGQASQVIDKVIQRRQQNLCTLKMAKVLARYGLNPDVQFPVAKRQLDMIAQSGWQVSAALRQQLESLAA